MVPPATKEHSHLRFGAAILCVVKGSSPLFLQVHIRSVSTVVVYSGGTPAQTQTCNVYFILFYFYYTAGFAVFLCLVLHCCKVMCMSVANLFG